MTEPTPGRLVVHPGAAARHADIETLRAALAALVEEMETLVHRRRDAILALYAREIGHLEYRLFLLDAEISELRFRVAFLQAERNRGGSVSAALVSALERKVEAEFEKTRREIERREEELRKSQAWMSAPAMPPGDAAELKSLYRRLCKQYHPDVRGAGGDAPARWTALQHAYRAGDLDLLRALAAGAGEPEDDRFDTPDALEAEAARLRARLDERRKRLAETLSAPPFSYEEKLRDSAWVREKQGRLEREIAAGTEKRDHARALYETLLAGSGTVH